MLIDTEHLHFWMCAIRESKDPKRTLDAFWRGQIKSKEWLINHLKAHIGTQRVSIEIHGGWVGVLASMLFQSDIPVRFIRSIDIDPDCEPIAMMMNKLEEQDGRFRAVTADMCNVIVHADVIINTSCEHISQEQYNKWLDSVPEQSLIVLQSNNYKIAEHIRTANNLKEFEQQSKIKVIVSDILTLPLYNRFMIIGKK